jgi:hypothetical protein
LRGKLGRYQDVAVNYVFSKAMDNFGAFSLTTTPEDPYSLSRDWSLSSEHAKHRLTMWWVAGVPPRGGIFRDLTAALIVTAQSPRYYNVTAGMDLNHDLNVNNDRPDVIGRNTFRGDDFLTIDTRVGRRFGIMDAAKLDCSVDILNLLNRVNITDLATVFGRSTLAVPPAATFNRPRAVGNAFQIQLGLRLSF